MDTLEFLFNAEHGNNDIGTIARIVKRFIANC